MEVKLLVETETESVKFSVCKDTGFLIIETKQGKIEVPNPAANELVNSLSSKLNHFDIIQPNRFWRAVKRKMIR